MLIRLLIMSLPIVFGVGESLCQGSVLSFEEEALPQYVNASDNSTLSLSDARYIDGKQSLRWQWSGGPAWLEINHAIHIEKGPQKLRGNYADDTFSPWIYLPEPMRGSLRFSFSNSTQPEPACEFEYGLAFSGWRTGWIMYGRDTQGAAGPDMDRLRISTPQGIESGEIFLDTITLSAVVDARHQYPDRQAPFVNRKKRGDHWLPRLSLLDLAPSDDATLPTPAQLQAVEEIESRVEGMYLDPSQRTSESGVAELLQLFESYNITQGPAGMRGKHVAHLETQSMILPEPLRKRFKDEFVELRSYQEHLLRIAQAYHDEALSDEHRDKLRDAFVLMVRHMLNQGWAEGSSLGTVHHLGYGFREVSPALLLMRDVLAEEKLLQPMAQAILWYFNTYMVFEPGEIVSNMDYYNTQALGHLISILLLADGPAKVATLAQYSSVLSDILDDQTPGTENGFKVDGTAFHHFGHYPSYALGAFNNGAKVINMLASTSFEISPAGRANFRHALMTARLYADPDWGIGFAGRHPMPLRTRSGGILPTQAAFINLALAGDPETDGPVDPQVLAAAFRMWPELQSDPRFTEFQVEPEPSPQGYWPLNYAAAGIHRHGNKTVTLKGYNDNVWSAEIYTRDNRFGRYQSNGSISILNQGGNVASGWTQPGWDWNRVPGTTGVYLPLDQLESPRNGTLALKSPNKFAGSNHLSNEFGVFAIDLHDDSLPGSQGLKARKSAFSFGPLIVCLGTGITSPNTEHPTQTTLFQSQLRSQDDPVWLNSMRPITTFHLQMNPSNESRSVMVDSYGNGYYIPQGQSLHLSRTRQQSCDDKTKKPTEGDFATAWLDHGNAPENEQYQYAILLGANFIDFGRFERGFRDDFESPYEVIQQDQALHAVHHPRSNVTGLAFFEADTEVELETSPIRSVSKPALVLSRPLDDQTLQLSVCDPSLNLVNGKSEPQDIVITVQGEWSVSEHDAVKAQANDGQTLITVTVYQAQPVQFQITRSISH